MTNQQEFFKQLSIALENENSPALDACLDHMLSKDKNSLKKFRTSPETLDTIVHLTIRTKSILNLRTVMKYRDNLDLLAKNHKYTSLCLACTLDEIPIEIIQILIQEEPLLINTPSSQNDLYPLHLAVQQCRLDIVKCLVTSGSFLNSQNLFRETPLHYACCRVDDTI